MPLSIVILAAGQGTRMRSDLPKVLQPLAGRPLLAHVVDTARALGAADICVVYGHGGDRVRDGFPEADLRWALQAEQLGTGHAVMQALPDTPEPNQVLVLCGDVPLIRPETLQRLTEACADGSVGVLTVDVPDPTGYGRIVRGADGDVQRIVEQKDASGAELDIAEINSGIIVAPAARLSGWLENLSADNAQGEYYLTDIIASAVADGVAVHGVKAESWTEVMGINDKRQLAEAERALQRRRVEEIMTAGATVADPARVDIRGTLTVGRDVFIDVNAVFEGEVVLGDRARIGPGVVVRDSRIGADSVIHPHTVIEESVIHAGCQIGPFARLRPGAEFADGSKAGNFVEVKKSLIGEGSKVNHLTYIGDTTIGRKVNVGAGTITCNYDGANKHRTVIGDGAFIGSGVNLVAPVEVGAGATIGAGSTISKPAPAERLTLARSKQITLEHWKRPQKKES
ncbi:bifunctional UDP-N-acetylglucosamine diphosphorylase/glucosamine-1-phosphate N-acetyltransferase GlmU [Lentisalinibacter salinarum]|uniref:bifunctional UDP-N-acetylglucosamine diphosphorylase/glucosamine-1-phosphate N-acetyltransferase GlmU n=1 Tax=Lentisalinibacter salinarum TaxID=2992239 RepID=UPI00386F67CD